MSRLRCPLRTPGVLLDKAADMGAGPSVGCLVSIGCRMAFGGVNKFLELDASAMFDVPNAAQAQLSTLRLLVVIRPSVGRKRTFYSPRVRILIECLNPNHGMGEGAETGLLDRGSWRAKRPNEAFPRPPPPRHLGNYIAMRSHKEIPAQI